MLGKITVPSYANQIRDLITACLRVELAQYGITNVETERFRPYRPDELPAINIILAEINTVDELDCMTSVLDTKYLVEVYDAREGSEDHRADEAVSYEVMAMGCLVRDILMYPEYRHLGMPSKDVIRGRSVRSITRTEPRNQEDVNTCAMSTLEITYTHAETVNPLDRGVLESSLLTQVKVNETDKGFLYER